MDNRVATEIPCNIPCYNLYDKTKVAKDFRLRAMTTMEEKLRLSSQGFDTIARIIKNCLVSHPDLDVKQLKFADINYLMYQLRIVTYGNIYNVNVRCPNCNKVHPLAVNLDDLTVTAIPEDFKEPFKIGNLPVSGDVLECRLFTTQDYIDIMNEAKRINDRNGTDDDNTAFFVEQRARICTVNGKTLAPFEMDEYIATMHARDYQYFVAKYAEVENKFGIDTHIEYTCPSCGETETISLPMSTEFFRPSLQD